MTGRHARVVYDLDAVSAYPAELLAGSAGPAVATIVSRLADPELPSSPICPVHGIGCEAWS